MSRGRRRGRAGFMGRAKGRVGVRGRDRVHSCVAGDLAREA